MILTLYCIRVTRVTHAFSHIYPSYDRCITRKDFYTMETKILNALVISMTKVTDMHLGVRMEIETNLKEGGICNKGLNPNKIILIFLKCSTWIDISLFRLIRFDFDSYSVGTDR